MIRILCSTGTCTTQAAQLANLRRANATLRGENAQLAADNARLRAELEKAQNGHAFYMGMYAEEKGSNNGR